MPIQIEEDSNPRFSPDSFIFETRDRTKCVGMRGNGF